MSQHRPRENGHPGGNMNGPVNKKPRTEDTIDTLETSASCGILEYITVKNFMCHDHLTFPFSPNINFVQGRNGSGKSAVLTALVVGLGGASRLTNRGSSLKELVKYGKQIATIEIAIKNNGKDSYHHELYGDTIIVERKINSTGGGSYKLLGKTRAVVSTKKDDLLRMLDHFNMQVDNPVTVLNQDMSRSFLNSTDPQAMYKFFLKATQLQQMKDDYKQLDNALCASSDIIQTRSEIIPHLKKEVDELHDQYQFCKTLHDKRKKMSDLRRELAWAMIISLEKDEENAESGLETYKKAEEKIKAKIDRLENNYKEEVELHKSYLEKFKKVTTEAKSVSKEVQTANEKVIKAKRAVKDKEGQLNLSQRKIKEIKRELSLLQEALDKANTNAQNQWAIRHEVWQKEMDKVKQEQDRVKQDARTEETHRNNITNTIDMKKEALTSLKVEDMAIRRKIGALEQELKGLKGQQNNQFTVFGQWVPQLLREIEAAFRNGAFSKKPVGPLGAFVKLHDNSWGHVAEAVLGSRINAFCVDNRNDEQVLRNIMNGINFGRQQQPFVIVCKFRNQVHDVSRFEVQSDKYPSLWSMLSISNTVVANTVIDQMQVESIMLIPTAEEAGQLLKDKSTVPVNCKVAYTLNRDIYYPDPNYRIYSGRGKQPARFLQVSVEQKLRNLETELETFRAEERTFNYSISEAHKEMQKLEEEVRGSNRKSQGHKKKLDQLRLKLANIQNQEEPQPPDMSQLEEDIKQQQFRQTEIEEILKNTEEEIVVSRSKMAEVSKEYEKCRKKEQTLYQEAENITEEVNKYGTRKNDMQAALNSLQKKFQNIEKQVKESESELTAVKEKLAKELKAAEKFQPRMNTRRKIDDVRRQHDNLAARLSKEQDQSGDPVVVTERYMEANQRYLQVSAEVEKHSAFIKEIKASLNNRQEKYERLRKLLSVMIKSNFKVHLSARNLQGNLSFDFEKSTLSLHVTQMNSGIDSSISASFSKSGKQNMKHEVQRKLMMMSGGERSFSTVSFIIALWHVIDSPIRVLDEFDVFMDIVARKRAMKMMIQAAKAKTQYIYLTPLELDVHPNIKVFRMSDPERENNLKDN